jgi:hypothetical protein
LVQSLELRLREDAMRASVPHDRVRGLRAGRVFVLTLLLVSTAGAGPDATEIFDTLDNEGARFLSIHADPRGEALGQAASALAEGIAGVCWNPAGLAFSRAPEAVEQGYLVDAVGWEVDWADRMDFTFLGVSVPIGSISKRLPLGTLAVWRRRVRFGNIVRTGEGCETHLGDLAQQAVGVSYAHLVLGQFAVGVTYKHVESDWSGGNWYGSPSPPATGDYGGTGWDIGITYRRHFDLGEASELVIRGAAGERNIGSMECRLGCYHDEYKLPRGHFMGVAPSLYLMDRAVTLTLSGEMVCKDRTMDWLPRSGVEVSLWDGLAVRLGRYESEEGTENVTTRGFGLRLRYGKVLGIGYDWAESDMAPETGDVQRHMLTLAVAYCDRGIDLRSLLGRYPGAYR